MEKASADQGAGDVPSSLTSPFLPSYALCYATSESWEHTCFNPKMVTVSGEHSDKSVIMSPYPTTPRPVPSLNTHQVTTGSTYNTTTLPLLLAVLY